MKLDYHPETDSLYIHLSEKPGVSVVEVADHVVLDMDENGVPVGIDIDANASKIADLSKLDLSGVSPDSIAFKSAPEARKAAS